VTPKPSVRRPAARRRRAPRGSGELLRGEIIAAARDCLNRLGSADAVSIRAVASHVGVTPPSIYLHFADKEALLDAVLVDLFGELDEVMQQAVAGVEHPLERLRQQGLAYVRFARSSPEYYRLATMHVRTEAGNVDAILGTAAFTHFLATVSACMDEAIFAPGDPLPIALELWAAAHGIASLLVAKAYLPWGDPELVADHVLRAAAIGHAVADLIGDPDCAQFSAWLAAAQGRPRSRRARPQPAG
jgi:AcrR family transcriptional regulator